MEKELIPVESKNLIKEALNYLGSIQEITITNDGEYNNALEVCKDVKRKSTKLKTDRKLLTDPLYKEQKAIKAEFDVITDKLDKFESTSKTAMFNYDQKKKIAIAAENKRLEAKAAEERRKAAVIVEKEAEKVKEYEGAGRQDLADNARIRQESAEAKVEQTVAPVITSGAPKGASFRTQWKIDVEKSAMEEAVDFCLKNVPFKQYLTLDFKLLEKLADSTKGGMKVDGLYYYEKPVSSVRT